MILRSLTYLAIEDKSVENKKTRTGDKKNAIVYHSLATIVYQKVQVLSQYLYYSLYKQAASVAVHQE